MVSVHDRSKLALRLEDVYRERAKANQVTSGAVHSGNQYTDNKKMEGNQKSDNLPNINTLKEVAKIAGVSHDTIHKVKTIQNFITPPTITFLNATSHF